MTFKIIKSPHRSTPLFWFLIFAVLFSIQVLPRLSQDASVGDENVDIVDGFYYWQGDVISASEHPPFAKALQALPLRFMGLQSKSGLDFSRYYVRDSYFLTVLNADHFAQIMESSRFVTYLFSLVLGLILFGWIRQESPAFVLTAMTLWVFEPALLAFSGYAMADLPVTFFFLAAVLRFQKLIQKSSVKRAVMTGLLSGMAVTVKFTAFLLIPVFLALEFLKWVKAKPKPAPGDIAKRWLWGLVTGFFWVCLVYLSGTLAIPGHPEPLGLFWNGIKRIALVSAAPVFYFRGVLSHKTHWDYYPTAFFLKSPLPFLILLSLGLWLVLLKKIKWPAWQWVPPMIFFLAFMFNHDMGLRLILPIYPFCILMAARAGEWLALHPGRIWPILWGGLLFFQALSVGFHYPAHVSYFNEMVAPERRLYWLGDSNLDFGQDTQRVAKEVQTRGWDHVKLAYFGGTNPKDYGMKWNYWTQKDLQGPQSGWVYLINDNMIQMGPIYSPAAPDIVKSWILKAPFTGQLADTWYYFEIPGKIQPDNSPKILSAPVFLDDPNAFGHVKPFKPSPLS